MRRLTFALPPSPGFLSRYISKAFELAPAEGPIRAIFSSFHLGHCGHYEVIVKSPESA